MTPDTEPIRQALTDLATLWPLLPEALTSNTHTTKHTPRTSRTNILGSPAPIPLDIVTLLDTRPRATNHDQGIEPTLADWCRHYHQPTGDVPTMCRHLTHALAQLTQEPDWPDFTTAITTTATAVRHALGETNDHHIWHEARFGGCGHRIEAIAGYWRCTGCGAEWTLHEVTLPEAARRLDIPERTLQRLASQGRFVQTGHTKADSGKRVRLFDLDTIRLACAHRAINHP